MRIVIAGRRLRLAVLLIWRQSELARTSREPDRVEMERDWIERMRAAERFHDALLAASGQPTKPELPNVPAALDRGHYGRG